MRARAKLIAAVSGLAFVSPGVAQLSDVQNNASPNVPATSAVTSGASPADAADAGGTSIADIVVTARRVNEKLQDVPIAITALSGDTLRQNRIVTVSDLRLVTPSLQITPSANGAAIPGITLRGQRSARTLLGQDPSIAVYFNEVPQTRSPGLDTSTYDLASVQVLKGPQGTLFGRNTTGGAILITPQKPTQDLGGYLDGTLGNYSAHELSGAFNLPVSDTLAIRAAGNFLRRDGYAVNVINGQDLFDRRSESGRLSVLFRPSSGIENLMVADVFHSHANGSAPHGIAIIPGSPLAARDAAGQLRSPAGEATRSIARITAANDLLYIESDVPAYDHTLSAGISNVTTIKMTDHLTLKNVFGYRHISSKINSDFDGTSANGLLSAQIEKVHWASDELQVIGSYDRLNFIAGVFVYSESGLDTGITQNLITPGSDATNFTGGKGKNESYSGFAQGSFKITPKLSLTLGGRYTIDDRSAKPSDNTVRSVPTPSATCGTRNPQSGILNVYPNCSVALSKTFREPTYTASLNYKLKNDILLYVAHRRGYRAGGFNVRARNPIDYQAFAPEIVRDVEAGVKADFTLGTMKARINVAAYKQWYKDIQRAVAIFDPVLLTVSTTVRNAASATIEGGEVEVTLIPVRRLSLSGFYSYVRPRYSNYVANGVDLSADKFVDVPANQGSATVRYAVPAGRGEVALSGTFYAQSGFELNDPNYAPSIGRAPGYHLFNARVEWTDAFLSGLDLSLFGENLANKRYITSGIANGSTGFVWAYPGAPRTYGIQAKFRF